MSFTLVLYSSFASARNPDIKASVNAMIYINNLRISDFQKISGRSWSDPYYALKDTPRSRLLDLLDGFEFQNIDAGELSPSVPNYAFDFVQINYSMLNIKGICISFTSAVAGINLRLDHGYKRGSQMWINSTLKKGTILATNPKLGGSGHIVMLMSVHRKYIWVLDQNAYCLWSR